ncbi:MAG: DUF2490 domain-containing protein [Flavobacteriaceae bacterium]|nr:DUF2490 domain-containing protein [Flavobacteriaceae bacterium]
MFGRHNLGFVYLALFMSLTATNTSVAQNSSIEFWPETDIWYRLNSSWRLSSFIPITKYNENDSRDLNVYLHVDYAWGNTKYAIFRRLMDQEQEQMLKNWMVRGGLMKGWSIGKYAGDYTEEMVFAEVHKRIPLKGNILLSHRFRTDTRWLGPDNDFSYRFRYRLMVEKEFKSGNYSIVPYVNIESYWDSRYDKLVKTRLIGGFTTTWRDRYAIEGNLTYQYDETYNTENLYALNVILHVFLEKNQNKNKTIQE